MFRLIFGQPVEVTPLLSYTLMSDRSLSTRCSFNDVNVLVCIKVRRKKYHHPPPHPPLPLSYPLSFSPLSLHWIWETSKVSHTHQFFTMQKWSIVPCNDSKIFEFSFSRKKASGSQTGTYPGGGNPTQATHIVTVWKDVFTRFSLISLFQSWKKVQY